MFRKFGKPILISKIFSGVENAVPSPCNGYCSIEASSGFCGGCQRTLNEITTWHTASEEFKRITWQAIRQRRQSDSASNQNNNL
ncbi:MAG: DUF1289 domain-containing protein [Pseudomonadota bacterium]